MVRGSRERSRYGSCIESLLSTFLSLTMVDSLLYFKIPGRAEAIRLMYALAQVELEDKTVPRWVYSRVYGLLYVYFLLF
ncbi:hypothetical protein KIPB_001084 [Kipferlia bialata]|uniref:Uncharacterized protein n=1 Tax=Kipferlia bialata TaxID=797122 RepID=A0A9K3GF04_9EUKA|nr:hypothetical protein KIPB_001084 [Kipferlia bialata]|eukprot:g1084.t1